MSDKTDLPPLPERFDCTNGSAQWCYGCYTMTRDDLGDYVLAEDYDALRNASEALQAEIERLRAEVAEWKRAAAAQETEIKALRAEVERLRADRDSWKQQASDRVTDWHAEYLRAERLAEALREWWSAHRPVGWTEDQHRARPYVNLITVADKALTEALLRDQEDRNG